MGAMLADKTNFKKKEIRVSLKRGHKLSGWALTLFTLHLDLDLCITLVF